MAYRIMIVDDEEAFVGIGEELLTRAGFEVRAYLSARSALQALPEVLPDMILSDVEMPLMDGFDFLRAVRADTAFANTPFSLMTAKRTFPPDRAMGLNLGSDDYINKPFSGDELVARVKALLRRAGKVLKEPEGMEATPPAVEPPPPPPPVKAAPVEPPPAPKAPPMPPPPPLPPLPAVEEPPIKPLRQILEEAPPPPASSIKMGPGPKHVMAMIRESLAKGAPVALILGDLSFFRGFNECKGYAKGDEVLEFTRFCLENGSQKIPGGPDLVLPLFADEFLILTEPSRAMDVAQAALDIFASGILQFYGEEDRRRGFLESKNRMGRAVAYPIINLVMGLSTNTHRKLTHPGQFVQICRELLTYAKTLGGSRCVLDRRKDTPPSAPHH